MEAPCDAVAISSRDSSMRTSLLTFQTLPVADIAVEMHY
jgi:hypothetical protein